MLNKLTRDSGKSDAQVIRDILDEYSVLQERRAAWSEILSTVQERMKLAKPGVSEPRTWKREDLYGRYERSVRHKRSRSPR